MQVMCRDYRSYIELWGILAGYGFQAKRFRQMQDYALTSCLIETLGCENTTLIRPLLFFIFFFNSLPSYTSSTTHVRPIPRYARFGSGLNSTTEKKKYHLPSTPYKWLTSESETCDPGVYQGLEYTEASSVVAFHYYLTTF